MWAYIFQVSCLIWATSSESTLYDDLEDILSPEKSPKFTDPELNMTAEEIIRYHGYPLEIYDVTTEDGYILTIQRIPYGMNGSKIRRGEPILIQHGIFCSASVWVSNTRDKNLPYILADAGYDVWLGNVRGTKYGKRHKYLSPDELKFWIFSWHEMAIYDLPAIIDFIVQRSGFKQIIYIGHSMGTTISYVLLSTQPKYNKIIKGVLSLASIANLSNTLSPLKYFSSFAQNLDVAYLFGVGAFAPDDGLMKYLARTLCSSAIRYICSNTLFLLMGFDMEQINQTRLPVFFSHVPEMTSVKTLMHYAQLIDSGRFQYYDYGSEGNLEKYPREKSDDDDGDFISDLFKIFDISDDEVQPPKYDVSKITTKVAIFWSENDYGSHEIDRSHLVQQLPNLVEYYSVPSSTFSHLDFLWGLDVKKLVYNKLLRVLKKM